MSAPAVVRGAARAAASVTIFPVKSERRCVAVQLWLSLAWESGGCFTTVAGNILLVRAVVRRAHRRRRRGWACSIFSSGQASI